MTKYFAALLSFVILVPALYLITALVGSLIPVNRGWTEPARGTTVYIADNGIHLDLIMPVDAQGLDWAPLLPAKDFQAPPLHPRFVAFGSGEQHVYLNTPSWWDITPATIGAALIGGPRVIHVEYVDRPDYAVRQIRVRPQEYRRLWAAVRADFALDRSGRPSRVGDRAYGPADAFYVATGKANALRTCNVALGHWLRLAGVKTSLWSPFTSGLIWRYRRAPHRT